MIRLLPGISLIFLLSFSNVERKGKLPEKLKEISGWIFANDSTLIAHNDGGNDPILYVLNLDGTIRHEAVIKEVKNNDFEDITSDSKGNLYLGDIGNNNNTRKNLAIYKIKIASVLQDSEVTAKTISYSYPEQEAFPPAGNDLNFDAESLAFYNDSLYIFTKCRTEPFDGKCFIYQLPSKAGVYKAKRISYLKTGKRSWHFDGVTAADIFQGDLYLLTYTRIMIYAFNDKKPVFKTQIPIQPISQKESLAVRKNGQIYVADEVNRLLGGGRIFVINQSKKKN